ncbi:MAG: DUF202 domain-containing protein [Flavobacteriales bacterium]|nr:DUF202 domain-containing protein [Flavobacteriales bacterium]MCB9198688.1 DUF202 domain-containing protein [Flavobacteriales bacterium]
MTIIKRAWVRFLIALAITGIGLELTHILTGRDLTRSPLGFVIFFVVYMMITFIYGYWMGNKIREKESNNEKLLDRD